MSNEKRTKILKSLEENRLEYENALNKEKAVVDNTNSTQTVIKLVLFLSGAILLFFFPQYMHFVVVFLVVMFGFVLQPVLYKPNKTKLNIYHRTTMETLLEELYPQVRYKGTWPVLRKDVEESLLFTGDLYGENHLEGTTSKGYKFECAEIEEKFDGQTRFRGVFFKIESPVVFSQPIVIRQKFKNIIPFHLSALKNLRIQELDSIFKAKYTILARDIIEANNILSPDFLQPVIIFSRQYLDIRWSFIGNQIYFSASTKTGLFNSVSVYKSILASDALEKFSADVELCQNFAESLGEQLDNLAERVKTGAFEKKKNIDDKNSPYDHLIENT